MSQLEIPRSPSDAELPEERKRKELALTHVDEVIPQLTDDGVLVIELDLVLVMIQRVCS